MAIKPALSGNYRSELHQIMKTAQRKRAISAQLRITTHIPYAIGINVELLLSKMSFHSRQWTRIIQCTKVVVMHSKVVSTSLANSYGLHCISSSNFFSAERNHTLHNLKFARNVITIYN